MARLGENGEHYNVSQQRVFSERKLGALKTNEPSVRTRPDTLEWFFGLERLRSVVAGLNERR